MTSIETIEKTITKCQALTDNVSQAWPESRAYHNAAETVRLLTELADATKRYDERTDPSAKSDAYGQVRRWDDELRHHLEQVHIAGLRESIHQTHHILADLYDAAWGCIA